MLDSLQVEGRADPHRVGVDRFLDDEGATVATADRTAESYAARHKAHYRNSCIFDCEDKPLGGGQAGIGALCPYLGRVGADIYLRVRHRHLQGEPRRQARRRRFFGEQVTCRARNTPSATGGAL